MTTSAYDAWIRDEELGILTAPVNQVLTDDWNRFKVDPVAYLDARHCVEYAEPQAQWENGCTLGMRGNTLVDISPREDRPRSTKVFMDDGAIYPCVAGYPLYQRDHMKADKAPTKSVERYVAPRVI